MLNPVRCTAEEIAELILSVAPDLKRSATCDTFKCGDPKAVVRGVVVTWMATRAVLDRAAQAGANLVITHEPTFFEHDRSAEMRGDAVVESKRKFADGHGIVVWRCHDSWHLMRPDGILTGVTREIGWENYQRKDNQELFDLPGSITLGNLSLQLKRMLGIPMVRVVGDLNLPIQRVALSCGSNSWNHQRTLLNEPGVDALVCGEAREWETYEYVRDSVAAGRQRGLVVLGHCNSEELGMRYLARWLSERIPGLRIDFVPAGDSFTYV